MRPFVAINVFVLVERLLTVGVSFLIGRRVAVAERRMAACIHSRNNKALSAAAGPYHLHSASLICFRGVCKGGLPVFAGGVVLAG